MIMSCASKVKNKWCLELVWIVKFNPPHKPNTKTNQHNHQLYIVYINV